MFSKMVVAAGLLSNVYAQSVSTVYSDVYLATTTISAACAVCTEGAASSGYTVVVSDGITTTLGSSAAASTGSAASNSGSTSGSGSSGSSSSGSSSGSSSTSGSSTCGFSLAVNGVSTLGQISDGQIQVSTLGQISDGQIQAGSGLTTSTFTLTNGMVYDQAGRICSISGQNQAQFQCNYVPTDGSTTTTFSIADDGNLAFNGSEQFYACLLGDATDGYNIYQTLTGNQNSCTAVTLQIEDATDCYDTTTTAASTPATTPVPAVVTTAVPAVVTTAVPVVAQSTSSSSLPAVSSSATVPISTGAASSISSQSMTALLVAASFAYFLI